MSITSSTVTRILSWGSPASERVTGLSSSRLPTSIHMMRRPDHLCIEDLLRTVVYHHTFCSSLHKCKGRTSEIGVAGVCWRSFPGNTSGEHAARVEEPLQLGGAQVGLRGCHIFDSPAFGCGLFGNLGRTVVSNRRGQ